MNYKYVEMDYKWSKFEIMLIRGAMVDVVIWEAALCLSRYLKLDPQSCLDWFRDLLYAVIAYCCL